MIFLMGWVIYGMRLGIRMRVTLGMARRRGRVYSSTYRLRIAMRGNSDQTLGQGMGLWCMLMEIVLKESGYQIRSMAEANTLTHSLGISMRENGLTIGNMAREPIDLGIRFI